MDPRSGELPLHVAARLGEARRARRVGAGLCEAKAAAGKQGQGLSPNPGVCVFLGAMNS